MDRLHVFLVLCIVAVATIGFVMAELRFAEGWEQAQTENVKTKEHVSATMRTMGFCEWATLARKEWDCANAGR